MHIDHFLTALKRGDQTAFRELVAAYREKVFNTAISMVQDHGTAEDIAQEVFITVFRSVASFNEQSSLSTWIYRITVNKCIDHLRTQQRRQRAGFLGFLSGGDSEAAARPALDHPGVQLEKKEKSKFLFAALDTLPENQRLAFVLAHIEELAQKEVGEIMGLGIKAVESLLQRAKGNLRKKLGEIYDKEQKT